MGITKEEAKRKIVDVLRKSEEKFHGVSNIALIDINDIIDQIFEYPDEGVNGWAKEEKRDAVVEAADAIGIYDCGGLSDHDYLKTRELVALARAIEAETLRKVRDSIIPVQDANRPALLIDFRWMGNQLDAAIKKLEGK